MRIYYYEYSDDRRAWCVGDCSFFLHKVIDKAQQQDYPWRIKTIFINKGDPELMSEEVIEEEIQYKKVLEKLFQ